MHQLECAPVFIIASICNDGLWKRKASVSVIVFGVSSMRGTYQVGIMANRTQEENVSLLVDALRLAGTRGLSIDQARLIVFGKDNTAGSRTKKLLDKLKTKGMISTQMGTMGIIYVINPGH